VKILFFIDCLRAGGKERRLTQLMKSLKEEPGIHFELVLMNEDIQYKEVLDWNIKIHYLIRKTKKDIAVFKKLYTICKGYKPDILHCWDSMTAVYAVPACKLLHIKLVNGMVVDSPEKKSSNNKVLLRARLTFPFSDMIIGNSKAGLAAYNAPVKKSVCIYNGFNFDRLKNITDKVIIKEQLKINANYVIGMVATFSEYKDYKTYYSAATQLLKKRSDICFLAVGNHTDSAASKNLVPQEYAGNFKLLGKRSDVESLVNMMDICVLATFTEGISNSILEYMALGKPVVATSGGGTNEIVDDNKTGFLINPSNPAELSAKLEMLLNDEALCIEMGLTGKKRIQENFAMDKMTNDYIVNYKKLTGKAIN